MVSYSFEGKVIGINLDPNILDKLAGLAIGYKLVSKPRVTKAAREQQAYFKGLLHGLVLSKQISVDESDKLYKFFIGD